MTEICDNSASLQITRVFMRSVAIFTIITLFFSADLYSQTEQLTVRSSARGPFVLHKVAPKENFYSIGRLFYVHPKHIASFNGVEMAKGLSIGQIIKIPLTDTNYSHKSDKGVPVYYETANGESVYNVSTNNSVLMERLRQWNQLPGDKLPAGTKLIVGYVVSNETIAAAVATPQPTVITKTPPQNVPKAGEKTNATTKTETKKEEVKTVVAPITNDGSKIADKASDNVSKTVTNNTDKEREKQNAEIQKPPNTIAESSQYPQGYFQASFEEQVKQQPADKEATVVSGIFKTSSGWSDAKYYMLMNGVQPGTIVKVTNPFNNKSIYAKLLGDINSDDTGAPSMRISNSAALALDIHADDNFTLKINY